MLFRTLTRANLPYILARLSCCCLLVGIFMSCAQPDEYIQIGATVIYADTIDNIAKKLQHSFPEYGEATLRSHLLMNGLAEAEILHQTHPEASESARQKMVLLLEEYGKYNPVVLLDANLAGVSHEHKATPPTPSQLGANVAAATAVLENGEWSPPVQTSAGWAIVFLTERKFGQRSTASLDVDIFQIEIADASVYRANRQKWQNAPLSGSDELISCLPYEFRDPSSRE